MADLDENGKPMKPISKVPQPPTDGKLKTKPTEPPVEITKKGFEYKRGNFDTSVITLLATINSNIVANTQILKKAIEESKK